MKSPGIQLKMLLAWAALVIVLVLVGWYFSPSQRKSRDRLADTPVPQATPGLFVYGTVRDLSGAGVENAYIYRSYASYPGDLLAMTDAGGNYLSDFYSIPGDEMITIWANKTGLVFEPDKYYWRHYFGYEQVECNFLAQLPWVTYLPIVVKELK